MENPVRVAHGYSTARVQFHSLRALSAPLTLRGSGNWALRLQSARWTSLRCKVNFFYPQTTSAAFMIDAATMEPLLERYGCGSKFKSLGCKGFSLWFHLPRCHFGYLFLSRLFGAAMSVHRSAAFGASRGAPQLGVGL